METWIQLFTHPADPFGYEIDVHAVMHRGSYQPYRPADRNGPAEGGDVDFHLAFREGGPPSAFLHRECSAARWAAIADALIHNIEHNRRIAA